MQTYVNLHISTNKIKAAPIWVSFMMLGDNLERYFDHDRAFVIMPEAHKRTADILKQLDQRHLFILDTGLVDFGKHYAGVCQNYRKDIRDFLESISDRLASYQRIVLLFSSNMRNYDTIKGFKDFFRKKPQFEAKAIRKTASFVPSFGDLCLVLDDNDLVRLILYSKQHGWVLGEGFGIISYNETPLKSVIDDGITTISPYFEQMGNSMASLILQNRRELIENPFRLIDRGSF